MATDEGSGPNEERMGLTDPGAIKALSHPARLSIVDHLGSTGEPATATELAQLVGLSPSATSYHLRAMAKYGLIEAAEGRGDGRERRWRVVGGGYHFETDPAGTQERREAEQALVAAVVARSNARVTDWLGQLEAEPAQWRQSLGISDSSLLVTPDELAELVAGYQELLRPYLRRHRGDPPPQARVVSAQLRLVPTTN
ncbi:winged helix-turn-helix transcriptional regulator [Natronosporangium hydrolyticum]|uniref:Winged helix-turn-helix transcriptional regulator n=1 Tax=Natronosporangium hydrolyticum TaxID=2811111 RepID=A0A895YFX2_9ACTN|nr:winged helix-turn-helix domain-containing protein [Natronosporangium hydrolyticum]QSB14369.1 winged helix-turn-helix transcriptional regulator [Natronosporangium hydrolyticum]